MDSGSYPEGSSAELQLACSQEHREVRRLSTLHFAIAHICAMGLNHLRLQGRVTPGWWVALALVGGSSWPWSVGQPWSVGYPGPGQWVT